MKRCFKCGTEKPLSEFYKHPQMGDGHLGKCKDCTRSDVRSNRQNNLDYYVEYDRGRAKLPHRVERSKQYQKAHREEINAWNRQRYQTDPLVHESKRIYTLRYRQRHPHIMKAHNAAARHRKDKPDCCQRCEKATARLDRHHPDYRKPLEIEWLCKKCHVVADRLRRELESA